MNYFFSHIPSDNWTDPVKKEEYEAIGKRIKDLEKEMDGLNPADPAVIANKNLIAGYLKQMDNLRTDYYRPPAQAAAPAAQPGKSCHFIHYFMVLIFFFFFFFFFF